MDNTSYSADINKNVDDEIKKSIQILDKLSNNAALTSVELKITEMDLSGKALPRLPAKMIILKNLTSLNLSNNPLLFKNDINRIEEEKNIIEEEKNIIEAEKKHKSILTIEILSTIKSLTSLNLSSNDLQELPANISTLSTLENLTSLNLSNNKLKELPDNISILKNLTSLDLSKNDLVNLPEDISTMSKLQILNLSENKLTSLPIQLDTLPNLVILYLKKSGITSRDALNDFNNRDPNLLPLFVSDDTVPAAENTVPAAENTVPADANTVPADANTVPADANTGTVDAKIVYTDITDNVIQFENVPALLEAFKKLPVDITYEKNKSIIGQLKSVFSKPVTIKPTDILIIFNRELCKLIPISCQIKAEFKNIASIKDLPEYKAVHKTGTKGGSKSKKTKKSRKSNKKTKRRKHKKH